MDVGHATSCRALLFLCHAEGRVPVLAGQSIRQKLCETTRFPHVSVLGHPPKRRRETQGINANLDRDPSAVQTKEFFNWAGEHQEPNAQRREHKIKIRCAQTGARLLCIDCSTTTVQLQRRLSGNYGAVDVMLGNELLGGVTFLVVRLDRIKCSRRVLEEGVVPRKGEEEQCTLI